MIPGPVSHLDDREDGTYVHNLASMGGHTLGHRSVARATDQTPDRRLFHSSICTAWDNPSDCIRADTLDCKHTHTTSSTQ